MLSRAKSTPRQKRASGTRSSSASSTRCCRAPGADRPVRPRPRVRAPRRLALQPKHRLQPCPQGMDASPRNRGRRGHHPRARTHPPDRAARVPTHRRVAMLDANTSIDRSASSSGTARSPSRSTATGTCCPAARRRLPPCSMSTTPGAARKRPAGSSAGSPRWSSLNWRSRHGGVAEWLNAAPSKGVVRLSAYREFESPPLRSTGAGNGARPRRSAILSLDFSGTGASCGASSRFLAQQSNFASVSKTVSGAMASRRSSALRPARLAGQPRQALSLLLV
jgi:hypothetical protein